MGQAVEAEKHNAEKTETLNRSGADSRVVESADNVAWMNSYTLECEDNDSRNVRVS